MQLNKKQTEILEVAINLFKERGYLATSMRDLAAHLHIKAPSLYAHIQSKDELLQWICFSIAQKFFEGLKEVQAAEVTANQRLNLFIEKHLCIVLENPNVTHIYSNEWKHLENRLTEFLKLRKKYEHKVEKMLFEIYHTENWELKSPAFTTKFILHTLNHSYLWFKKNRHSTPEIADEIRDKVLYGLLGRY
ncbi:TetR family transcriptional regulator [Elizabethkingia argentiflava]|uniref:TetR family transcriptional regulator n=1 Tax=Elizabethkingia argenteiflava TaxID=2681556 RepID=A0A845PV25_9FLAO|nr:TetR/AcrR family transcriptional regulator [Elizabethkingia argenteiflava]NAW51505.1 TetR family transcriptional regulator [Elizabethkingia argenteiflava]